MRIARKKQYFARKFPFIQGSPEMGCLFTYRLWSLQIKSQAQSEEEEKVHVRKGHDKKAGESQPGRQI